MSERVSFARDGHLIDGWALNASRGGLRAIVEEPVDLGGEYAIVLGDAAPRFGRVVWIQEEPDGAIVGVSFLDASDDQPSEPPPASGTSAPSPPAETPARGSEQ